LDDVDSAVSEVIREEVDRLAKANVNVNSMNYFYDFAKELFSKRLDELHRSKEKGVKVIGAFCNLVPEELILAVGARPIRLCTGFYGTTLTAEEVMPRLFCPLVKSFIGFFLGQSKLFQVVDAIIVPTTCDCKKRLGEVFAEMKPTWILEVPQNTETPQARDLWLEELKLLKEHLEQFTKNRIGEKELREAIDLCNRRRAVVRRLQTLRGTLPNVAGNVLLAIHMLYYDDAERGCERAEALCDELEKRKKVGQVLDDDLSPRILLAGSPIIMPNWKLPHIIEDAGGVVVCDDLCSGTKGFYDPVQAQDWTMDDMLIAIAERYLTINCPSFTPNLGEINRILRFVEDFQIDGVVYHVLQGCHPYSFEARAVETALKRRNIPMIKIDTDYSREDVEQIRMRIEAFLEMVVVRKGIKK